MGHEVHGSVCSVMRSDHRSHPWNPHPSDMTCRHFPYPAPLAASSRVPFRRNPRFLQTNHSRVSSDSTERDRACVPRAPRSAPSPWEHVSLQGVTVPHVFKPALSDGHGPFPVPSCQERTCWGHFVQSFLQVPGGSRTGALSPTDSSSDKLLDSASRLVT